MEQVKENTLITICMGSSCFSRGGNKILTALQKYLDKNELDGRVSLKGKLCEDVCSKGPSITIDDQVYHQVDPGVVLDLLEHHLNQSTPKRECL